MKRLSVFVFLLFYVKISFSQYYYQDIVATQQANQKWALYKSNKVRSVIISSFEKDDRPTEGFECRQNISRDFSKMTTYTKTNFSKETFLTSFYSTNGLLEKTVDTGKNYLSTTAYIYDQAGNVLSITNTSTETFSGTKDMEEHSWKYNADSKPVSMVKVKNGTDTTFISLVQDEKGNVVEERPVRNNNALPVVYYYYDDRNRLTDVVRYNDAAKRLLPEYMFAYNSNDRLSSMLYVVPGSSDYQKWLYEYHDNGLRSQETCYNKLKELLGKIGYQYNY